MFNYSVCNEDVEARVFLFLITSERLIALREKFVKNVSAIGKYVVRFTEV